VLAISDIQLDAMRELTNVGSGTAATALSSMIGIPVDVDVPNALSLPLADAIDRAGPSDEEVVAIAIPVSGDLEAIVLILMKPATVETICRLLCVEPESDMSRSALCEIGNILGASYMGALQTMSGLAIDLWPPEYVRDMLGAILGSALLGATDSGVALLLESRLTVDGQECSPSFMFIPTPAGVDRLLSSLGVTST